MNDFPSELIFLIIIAVVSISINIVIFSLYFRKRGLRESYERITKTNKTEDYKKFEIPALYKKDSLQLSFDKHVKQKEDFDKWKQTVISKFQEIHKIPILSSIHLFPTEKIFTKKRENYVVTKYSTKAQDGDLIFFYELLPHKIKENNPTLFIVPGSGNQGARDVIDIPSEFSKYYYQQGIGDKIANEGYIVYVIENRGWGERTIDAGTLCKESDVFGSGEILERQLKNLGYDLINLQIIDTLQIFKSIQSISHVNLDNMFILGITHGGKIALRSSLFLPELKGAMIASSLFSTEHFGTKGNGYTHGLLKYFDNPDLAATISPKPLYLSWGLNENFPHGSEARTSYSANLIKKAYSIFGLEKNLTTITHNQTINSGHTVDESSILNFLRKTS
jgi:cephalosporin-C deacetylase-like acetyl esterase